MIRDIYKKILASSSFLLLAHKDPDGDALGSVTALADFLLSLEKKVQIFIPGQLPRNFNFLPHFNLISNFFSTNFDLIIACDYSDFKRTGFNQKISEDLIITFDHHIKNSGQKGVLTLIDANRSSTCELLYFFFKESNISISKNIATSLLTGILTDTGFFKNPNVSPATFEAVKNLILKGAPLQNIISRIYNLSDQSIKLWAEALLKTKFDQEHKIVYAFIPFNDFNKYDNINEINGFSSFINSISEARVALTLTEQEQGILKGSLRAKSNGGINVAQIAQKLGGGGHQLAAGFESKENFDKILFRIKNEIQCKGEDSQLK